MKHVAITSILLSPLLIVKPSLADSKSLRVAIGNEALLRKEEPALAKDPMAGHAPIQDPPTASGARRIIKSSVCDQEGDLRTSVSYLSLMKSPLFLIGPINIIDLIATFIATETDNSTSSEDSDAEYTIFPPQVVCAGALQNVAVIGSTLYDVDVCESIDFLNDDDVLAFGFQKTSGLIDTGFCSAFNPFTGTIGLGQVNIIPSATIAGILTLKLDVIGFSLHKKLSRTTRNDMWDNSGPPAPIDVPGHVVVRGRGYIGFEASESINVSIEVDLSLLIDADYNNDGIDQVFRNQGDDISDIDFALLLSGSASPKFMVTSDLINSGNPIVREINLSNVTTGEVDIYTVVNGGDRVLQLAGSINMNLQGICDASDYLQVLCEIFDEGSHIFGYVRSYVSSNGFGIMWTISGYIGLQSDFLEFLVRWPDDGLSFDAELSLIMNDGVLDLCVKAVTKRAETCFNFCTEDGQCAPDRFCDAFGACIWKKSVGGTCLKDSGCKSGICKNLVCSECSRINSTSQCPSGQFCTTRVLDGLFGLRCMPQLDVGKPCSHNKACQSGHCVSLVCSECPAIDSISGCDSGQFCGTQFPKGLACENQRQVGSSCSSDNACQSGHCVSFVCSGCPKLDSTAGCPSGQFCSSQFPNGLVCKDQRPVGSWCTSDSACLSGNCSWLKCRN